MIDLSDRHPGTQQIARWLVTNPNLATTGRAVAEAFEELAELLIEVLPDGPELTAGLRKMLEAKDCLVRAALDAP